MYIRFCSALNLYLLMGGNKIRKVSEWNINSNFSLLLRVFYTMFRVQWNVKRILWVISAVCVG